MVNDVITRDRPPLMSALALFCLVTVALLVYRDLLVPEVRDVEVWLGFELRGTAARLTAPVHWAIFALGAWGAWHDRRWFLPCAAGYTFYVALSHLVWSEVSPNGGGWPMGLLYGCVISILGFVLLRARGR